MKNGNYTITTGSLTSKTSDMQLSCSKHPHINITNLCTFPKCPSNILICEECSLKDPTHEIYHKNFIEGLPEFIKRIKDKIEGSKLNKKIISSRDEISKSLKEIGEMIDKINSNHDNFVKDQMNKIQTHLTNFFTHLKENLLGKDIASLTNLYQSLKTLEADLDSMPFTQAYNSLSNNITNNTIQCLLKEETYQNAYKVSTLVKTNYDVVKTQKEAYVPNMTKSADIENHYSQIKKNIENFLSNLYQKVNYPLQEIQIQDNKYHDPAENLGMSDPKDNDHHNNSYMTTKEHTSSLDNSNDSREKNCSIERFSGIEDSSYSQGSLEAIQKSKGNVEDTQNLAIKPFNEIIIPELAFNTSNDATTGENDPNTGKDFMKKRCSIPTPSMMDKANKLNDEVISRNPDDISIIDIPSSLTRIRDDKFKDSRMMSIRQKLLSLISCKDPLQDIKASKLFDEALLVVLSTIPETEFIKYSTETVHLYYGNLQNRKKEGLGIIIYSTLCLYFGEFYNDKPDGYGIKIVKSGDFYDGSWLEGIYHGQGKICNLQEGEIYQGDLWNGIRHGNGYVKRRDGSVFSGILVNGIKEGKGYCKWPNGELYEGNFKNDKMEGKGYYLWNKNAYYVGYWKNNMMDGKGLICEANVGKYLGDFCKDLKHGYGCYIWNDKWSYRGDWNLGLQDGCGLEIEPNGKKKLGIWKQGLLVKIIEES